MHTPTKRPNAAGAQTTPDLRQRAEHLRARVPTAATDPIFAAIAESRRLMPAVRRTRRLPDVGLDRPAEQDAADDALWGHFDDTLLKTTPTTPAGAIALAAHVLAFDRFQGRVLREERLERALALIARVPAA